MCLFLILIHTIFILIRNNDEKKKWNREKKFKYEWEKHDKVEENDDDDDDDEEEASRGEHFVCNYVNFFSFVL